MHSAHRDVTLSTSEAPQSGDFAGLTRVNDHIWVAQYGMVEEVVIFPADLEKSTLVVERRVEAEFFPKRPLRHKFTRPNDASAGSVTIAAALYRLPRKLRNLKRSWVVPLAPGLIGRVERNPGYAVGSLRPVGIQRALV